MLPQRRGQQKGNLPDVNSVVINGQQASWILQKITESTQNDQVERGPTPEQIASYKLTLLYRESRDNSDNKDEKTKAKKFRQMCTNKGPTVAVGRVKDTGEILGGYNPLSWKVNPKIYGEYDLARESFIFLLDNYKNDAAKNIISFVKKDHIIYEYSDHLPYFNGGLSFGGYNNNGGYSKPIVYDNGSHQLPIRSTNDSFTWDDWEVFSVDNNKFIV